MEQLNILEQALLSIIFDENKTKYPLLELHRPFIRIKNREYTGVGVYSNFEYAESVDTSASINDLLSSNKRLLIDGVENELSYALDITDGRINFLEIVSNGNEQWDGKITNFKLVD